MMKYNIVYSRISNHFFFISNLAEWHFSCRAEYNKIWIEQSGELTEKEGVAVKEFGIIMRKYGFEYKKGKSVYLGQYFFLYSEKDVWVEVKKHVAEEEYEKIRGIFRILEPRFKKVWNEKGIKKWSASFKKIAETEQGVKLMAAIKNLIGSDSGIEKLAVHIIPSPINNKTVSGGANLGPGHITIEVAVENMTEEYFETAFYVMAHEAAHVILDGNRKLSGVIKKLSETSNLRLLESVKPKMSARNIITEIVVETLAPGGYICQEYARHSVPLMKSLGWLDVVLYDLDAFKEKKIISYGGLYRYVVWQLYPLAQYYFEKKRPIDKAFIEAIIKTIKDIKKTGTA